MNNNVLKNWYTLINIILVSAFLILFFSPYFILDNRPAIHIIGLIDRTIMATICLFNGIWIVINNSVLFLKVRNQKVLGMILIVVGLCTLVTVFMGCGFNNY